ncbi:MAG: sigma-70 family RNA polymerase sigma factor [Sediminibacterium sp.]|nr:sigma-70 family RNA polymerase sigma factor [Sediminibacterium sp.]MCA6438969.1 sigma-70 family RNA polymerase sigma factor [Chitinophagaceae bacterium]MCA6445621.1 sigma-70 family RNA polymerase sigma factor [Chitinophagaceae bacterium]
MSYCNEELKHLLDGCRKNSRSHEKLFFEWLKEFAANVCYRYASSKIEVQGLVCDGFVKAFKNLHLYNEDIYGYSEAAFKGWFKKVLINNCINYLNKFHPKIEFSDANALLMADISDDSESVLDAMSYNEILETVMELPPAYRMVFNLFVIDGYTHEEVAGILGITEGTSKSNLFKAKHWLQKVLQKKMKPKRYV